jgi:hypothetical protein
MAWIANSTFISPFKLSTPDRVYEFLDCLRDDRVAVVVQPIDQWADRRELLIFGWHRDIECPKVLAPEFLKEPLVIDIEAKRFGRGVEIGAVN